jgi:hypothetical protein
LKVPFSEFDIHHSAGSGQPYRLTGSKMESFASERNVFRQ